MKGLDGQRTCPFVCVCVRVCVCVCGVTLDVIVECAVLVAVLAQQAESIHICKVSKLNKTVHSIPVNRRVAFSLAENTHCSLHIHHCLVWIGHQTGRGQTTMHSQGFRKSPGALHSGLTHVQSQETGRKHHCRSITPWTQPVPTSPLWLALQSMVCQNNQTQEQFLPTGHHVNNPQTPKALALLSLFLAVMSFSV